MSVAAGWDRLTAFSQTYTCYSSAVAAWSAHDQTDWPSLVNPGLTLSVTDAGDGLFGFSHFPPSLRARLGLQRVSLQEPTTEASEAVLAELQSSGRVIVAGDGLRLPWHVAHGRRHVPHWYVLTGAPDELEVIDPFACRNELGVQEATRAPLERQELAELLVGLPGDDPVFALRERFALGDDHDPPSGACQWFVREPVIDSRAPAGAEGADGVSLLARHFREHTQDREAYRQPDDIWSIARHRAFLARHASEVAAHRNDEALATWVREHGESLAKRWSHMAPLLMQAMLTIAAGRVASSSVADTLEDLAARELAASRAFPSALDVGSI